MQSRTSSSPRVLAAIVAGLLACAPARSDPARTPPAPSQSAGEGAARDSVKTTAREVTRLAEGVYAIRHPDAPDTFPQGNTTVVIGDREALVVDSCYLPSSAREDIAQIRQWTRKPVRYLVNTHWHFDHTMGNAGYLDAFPSLTIVAHAETRKQIAGYDPGWFERFPRRAARFRELLEKGVGPEGKPYSASDRAELTAAAAGVEPVAAEFAPLGARVQDMTPTLTFERSVEIDLGHRRVQVLFLGRGNTLGDAVVYLPDEKIVATGDLLDHPVPYLGGGYPVELVTTLEGLARLDPKVLVPGHGQVLHDTAYLRTVIDFLQAVIAAVDRELGKSTDRKNAAEMKKAVLASLDVAGFRAKLSGPDEDSHEFFDDFTLPGVITAAHAELWPR